VEVGVVGAGSDVGVVLGVVGAGSGVGVAIGVVGAGSGVGLEAIGVGAGSGVGVGVGVVVGVVGAVETGCLRLARLYRVQKLLEDVCATATVHAVKKASANVGSLRGM
jgi:hypothetical protein